jgi:hypothetical protein
VDDGKIGEERPQSRVKHISTITHMVLAQSELAVQRAFRITLTVGRPPLGSRHWQWLCC